jgi:Flp pilus assembly pilin Flp
MMTNLGRGDAVTDLFRQYCKDESGATAIEYGLCCMILLGALISIMGTGGAVDTLFKKLTALVTAMS